MESVQSSEVTKELLLRFVNENIEYQKRSNYLQEIIRMSRKNDVLRQLLLVYFDSPMYLPTRKEFSTN
jgi:hypothetical protein